MKTLSLKVAIGYIVIIALFIGTSYYIQQQASIFSSSNKLEDSIQSRRSSCDKLIELVLEAEALAQTSSIGDYSSYKKYLSTINRIDTAIILLDSISTDSSKLLLDSLANTIHYKALIVKNLYDISSKKSTNTYQKQIEDLIEQYSNTTNTTNTISTIIREQKAITIETPKKNVMKRIKAVFKPGDIDTTSISNTSTTSSDTITRFETKATNLKSDFNRINSNAIQQKIKHINKIKDNIEILRIEGGELSLKISSLINYIERAEHNFRQLTLSNDRELRNQSVDTTYQIAIIASALAILFFIIIWRDITRRNRYRKELEEARLKAENLLIAREKLMLTITHDIKAPAGAIKGYTELIESEQQPSKNKEYVQAINNSATHLLNLVSALLDYHKLDFGEIEIARDQFHVSTVLDGIVKNFAPAAKKKGLSISSKMASSTDCYITCDLFRLRQIIDNLLGNAIKFTDKGDVSLSANIIGSSLNLIIKDSGRGISQEEQEVIFEEFARLKNATGIEGSGLGLSIVSKITNLMGGEISLSSSPDEGTSFFVTIPIEIVEEPNIDSSQHDDIEPQPANTLISHSILKIVIVDDDPIQLEYTQAMLHSINNQWDITCCANIDEDFERAISDSPHIIFSDINMPQINGLDLAKKIRQSLPSTPIIALTANSNIPLNEYTENGFSYLLAKPYNRQQLIEVLNKFISINIDLSAITQFADNDEETKTLLLTTALEETTKNGEAITKAITACDKESTCAIAHKMLPLISMIKAPGVEAFEYFNDQRNSSNWTTTDSDNSKIVLETIATTILALKKHCCNKKV